MIMLYAAIFFLMLIAAGAIWAIYKMWLS